MATNEYDQIIRELSTKDGAETLPVAVTVDYSGYIFLGIGTLLLAALVLGIKKKIFSRFWCRFPELAKAFVSGALLWALLVVSSVILVAPYGSRLDDEDYLHFIQVIAVPPACILLIYLWWNRFVRK